MLPEQLKVLNSLVKTIDEQGLGGDDAWGFYFDLESRRFSAKASPAGVMKILKLALDAVPDGWYARALLRLVAKKSALIDPACPRVTWVSAFALWNGELESGEWISLGDWLKEQGQNPEFFFPTGEAV